MTFNSLEFLVFFPVVCGLFFALPHRLRGPMVLGASFVFYGWFSAVYLALMIGTASLDWWIGVRIADTSDPARKWRWLLGSLVSNLGVLAAFKYWNLLNDVAIDAASAAGFAWPLPRSSLVLPVGISFYTFQSLSYTIDVYRGVHPPERRWWFFLLYVSYFPQLVAGPIERADRLLPQLDRPVAFDADRVVSGLRLAAWGMFKKVAVADRIGELVDYTYADLDHAGGAALLLGTILFGYQVYCDFSGYTDVARGVARVLGHELMSNFEQPLLARSMSDLWGRWHISMTSWFRDYVFIPLGGSRVSRPRWVFNVMLVSLASGLWHGASWHFVGWGGVLGGFLVAERLTAPARGWLQAAVGLPAVPRLQAVVQWFCTWMCWNLSVAFFRAETLPDALWIAFHMSTDWLWGPSLVGVRHLLTTWHTDVGFAGYCVGLLVLVEFVEYGFRSPAWRERVAGWPLVVRWSLDWAVVFGALLLGNLGDAPFIYFQF
jgi:D-alanyl-lipoteichoic acid acyltransferase DltB (MBOAT superfamily)